MTRTNRLPQTMNVLGKILPMMHARVAVLPYHAPSAITWLGELAHTCFGSKQL